MTVETPVEVAALQRIGRLVSQVLHRMLEAPGAPLVVTQH